MSCCQLQQVRVVSRDLGISVSDVHTHMFTLPFSSHPTHYIPSHASNEIDDPRPQPANGPLDLEPNVQLDGHDEHNVNHPEVNEDGQEEPPELVGVREVGGPRVGSHACSVEPADLLHAVHLQTAAEVQVELPAACVALLLARHQTPTGDGDAAGVKGGRAGGAGTGVVGYVGEVPLVHGAIDGPREAGAVLGPDGVSHVVLVLAAPDGVLVVAVELRVPVADLKVSAHAWCELGANSNQLLRRQTDPQVNRFEVSDALGGIRGVRPQ